MSEKILSTVGISLVIVIGGLICAISGCAVLEAARDAILGKPDTGQIVPTTPNAKMWEKVKGLTPNWLAIPIIALGAAVMYNGFRKLGMSCVIFGSVNLFVALATARFAFWMALFGFIGTMAALMASILTKDRALREIVGNVQDIKTNAKDDNVDLVFQDRIKETLTKQLKSTKKIVAKIKKKLI